MVVTHDPLEAMVLADRILVIENGGVVQHGTPSEVSRRPRTDYVARLVGLNLYAGVLDGASHTVSLAGGGSLVVTQSGSALPDGPVLVALRPAAVTIHAERPHGASPRNVWAGTVVELELVGDRVRVQVDGAPPALVDITPDAVADLRLSPGAPVWLSAKATETETYRDVDIVPT